MQKTANCSLSLQSGYCYGHTPNAGCDNRPDKLQVLTQMCRIMRLLSFFLFVMVMNVYASGNAQNVTLNGKGLSLKKVFSVIKEQTGYHVFFKAEYMNETRPVSVNVNNMPLKEFLELVLRDQSFTYSIQSKTITLLKMPESVVAPEYTAPPAEVTISGRVTDIDNTPLEGATVGVAGTRLATATDAQGRFIIRRVPEGSSLIISSVGYLALSVRTVGAAIVFNPFEVENPGGRLIETEGNSKGSAILNTDGTIKVQLARLVKTIEDVVITGMTQRSAKNFTGASRTFSGAELKTISANNVFNAISAFEPSFRIIPNNIAGGNINQLPDIQLRGANSLPNLGGELAASSNLPLFILDGFEVTLQRIVDLDMNLISSVTILKDASATAIYGSRGANGVMVVTTLAPKPGKLQVVVTNDFRFTNPDLSVYNLLNAREKIDFEKRAGVYIGSSNQDQNDKDIQFNQRLKAVESGVNTNWKKIPVQNGYSNRTSVYVQGGDNSVRYGLQVAADLQNGVMKEQDRKNYSGQFDLQYNIKKARFSNSVRIYQNIANESPYGDFSDYLGMNPYWSPFDETGKIKQLLEDIQVTTQRRTVTNPLFDVSLHSVNRQKYFGFTDNFTFRYDLNQNFFVQTNFSLTKQTGASDQFFSAADSRFIGISDPAQKGSYTVRNDESFGYESLTTINYNINKGKNQFFNTAALNFASTTNSYYAITAQGFPFDRLDNLLFAAQYPAGSRPTGDESTVRRLGLVYTGNYSYDNRFLADVSYRRDGSSQFGALKRFGDFWSTGIGWNIHNERLFKNNPNVNTLRIRASYGSTGSLNIPAYSAQWRYTYGVDNLYFNDIGAVLQGLGNETLKWQNVYKLNIGLNALLFREKLDVRVDLYRENTKNALSPVTLAPSTGFANYQENLGEVVNKGFEFAVRYRLLQNNAKGLLWTVNMNGFTNDNILKKISNKLSAINSKLDTLGNAEVRPNIQLKEGQSMNTIYVVRSLGVDPATGQEIYLDKDGKPTYVWDVADKVAAGINIPKWSGNFGTNFAYMGWDLNLVFSYQFGGQMYNSTLAERVESADPTRNVDRRAYDLGWTKPGDRSQYTQIRVNKPTTKLTSRFVQDDNTVTLSSGSLGYNFYRSAFLKKIKLNSLSVRFITNDVFRVSSIQIERGTNTPFARTYSLSIRAGF